MVTKTSKTAAKPARAPRAKKADTIYWVLSERSKLFVWKPILLFTSYDAAATAREAKEAESPYSLNGYKVDRVELA